MFIPSSSPYVLRPRVSTSPSPNVFASHVPASLSPRVRTSSHPTSPSLKFRSPTSYIAVSTSHITLLSPGQMDREVVSSGRKLNLRRDLSWVAKRTGKIPHKYTRVAKNPFQSRYILYFIANNPSMDVTQLALTWVGWPNDEKLALI